jgi:hypothetical protein
VQPQNFLSYLIEVSEDSKHWLIAQLHVWALWHIDGFLTHTCHSELQNDSPPTFVTESMHMIELQLLFLSAIFVFTPSSYLMKPSEHLKSPQSFLFYASLTGMWRPLMEPSLSEQTMICVFWRQCIKRTFHQTSSPNIIRKSLEMSHANKWLCNYYKVTSW